MSAAKPNHYHQGKTDTLDLLAALGTDGAFAQGSAIKYLHRYEDKGTPQQDLLKALFYVGWLIGSTYSESPTLRRALAVALVKGAEEVIAQQTEGTAVPQECWGMVAPEPVEDEEPKPYVAPAMFVPVVTVEASTAGSWAIKPALPVPAPPVVPEPKPEATTISRKDLSALLGCDITTIGNYEKKGFIKRIEGTGTKPSNTALYRRSDIPALQESIAQMQEGMRESLRRVRINPKTKTQEAAPKPTATPEAPKPSTTTRPVLAVKQETPAPKPIVEKPVLLPRPEPAPAAPPVPAFDINDAGKWAAVDEGKAMHAQKKLFYLIRHDDGKRYVWDYQDGTKCAEGWEVVEEWRKTGTGRWESTPDIPGIVGVGTGITHGVRQGVILG